jgi:hypothetical protein
MVDLSTTGSTDDVDSRKRKEKINVHKIFKCWIGYKNRRIFIYLRHAICRAEQSLTYQVLRKISPQEASLLKDPTLNARLRFRFAGENYPPVIVYKIFINANVQVSMNSRRISGIFAHNFNVPHNADCNLQYCTAL